MKKAEWFYDERFWGEFAPIMFDRKHWEEVDLAADAVTRMAHLNLYEEAPSEKTESDMKRGFTRKAAADGERPRLLDLCCGFGRMSLEFARRGFAVTGVDITKTYLAAGREDAAAEGLEIEFVEEDIRRFRRNEGFDLAVNLYNSFGYFEDPAGDRIFVKNVYDSLIDGGTFIIDVLGKEIAVRDYTEAEWFEKAGCIVLTEYEPVDSWGSIWNRWILIKNTERIEKVFIQRLYAASELRSLLLGAGFELVEIYGHWDESPYDTQARSLIAVARKKKV
ncbi:MAG: class I SAM-dependent methyltransferase [Treponema sp.]|nr:class I SAM-dependent methyltransferase [Treponema sp.]